MKYWDWILALLLLLSPALAQSSPTCLPLPTARETLLRDFNEVPVARALENKDSLIEILVNRDSGSFTIITINPMTGIACVVASGEDYYDIPTPGPAGQNT